MISYQIARPEHLDLFEPSPVFQGEIHCKELLRASVAGKNGFSYTYFVGNQAIGIIGGDLLWQGVAEVWAWLSQGIEKYPIEFTKRVIHCLNFHKEKVKLHRYQMNVREKEIKALRWAKTLGFQEEGIMFRYGRDGSNYIMMGRL